MSTPSPSPPPTSTEAPPSFRGVYVAGYILLGLLLAGVLFQRWFRPLVLADPISVVSTRPAIEPVARRPEAGGEIDPRIDPNTASWAELTSLPRVGEAMAKRIVEYRESRLASEPGRPAFTCPQDLEPIRGIGPQTIEQIAPRLRFPVSRPS